MHEQSGCGDRVGAGNTSLKQDETDFRGRTVAVMRVKGSGRDLAAAVSADFAGVLLDDLAPLRERDAMTDEAMVDWLADRKARALARLKR